MNDEKKKADLPKEVQIQMMKFFLKTSIPKSIKNKNKPLSEKSESEGEKAQ
ncbi:MAG: hypothetical protein FWH10_02345 [Oscillospiraceae bacterium]|nr:hypothetical protein [Oscillospiraceae bacterium]